MSVPTITGRMERKIAEGGMEASDGMGKPKGNGKDFEWIRPNT